MALLLAPACAGPDNAPHPSLAAIWRDYRELPSHRALAIAGYPERARWVAGASGGNPTREAAEQRAIDECLERRQRQRVQSPCRLYATGDEIVWSSP